MSLTLQRGCSLTENEFFFIKFSPFFESQTTYNMCSNLSTPQSSPQNRTETVTFRRNCQNCQKEMPALPYFRIAAKRVDAYTQPRTEGMSCVSWSNLRRAVRERPPPKWQYSQIVRRYARTKDSTSLQRAVSYWSKCMFSRTSINPAPSVYATAQSQSLSLYILIFYAAKSSNITNFQKESLPTVAKRFWQVLAANFGQIWLSILSAVLQERQKFDQTRFLVQSYTNFDFKGSQYSPNCFFNGVYTNFTLRLFEIRIGEPLCVVVSLLYAIFCSVSYRGTKKCYNLVNLLIFWYPGETCIACNNRQSFV